MISQVPYWQMSLAEQGAIVEGIDDIQQCLETIILTEQGSQPLMPEFGANVYSAVDAPASDVLRIIKTTITEQIARYEPRAVVVSLAVKRDGLEKVKVSLTWKAKSDTKAQLQNIELSLIN